MSNKNFKIEDFVQNASFRAWVEGNDPDANAFWEKWLINHTKEQEKVEQARQIVKSLSFLDEPMPKERKLAVWHAISAQTGKSRHFAKKPRKRWGNENLNLWLRASSKFAASILVVLAIFYVFSSIRDSVNEIKLAEDNKQRIFQKETESGQRINFKLPDGSMVYLNSDSRVSYKTGQDGFSREIFLEGEAFFDVKEDEKRPFKVFANATEITAIGTEFYVKIGQSDINTEVSLVEGKVEVVNLASESKEAIYLNEGERAYLVPSEKTMTKSTFEIELVTFWKDGLLLFENTSILTVKEVLEQWYDINIIFQNKYEADLKVTGRFDNEYLRNVLESLSYTARFNYRVEDRTIYIKFKSE